MALTHESRKRQPVTSEELQKRFEATDRKTVLEGIEQDLPRFESEKIVEIFTDVDRPAKFHGTLEDASGEATCSLQASATIETAALIDDDEADIVRHVTNVVYDGENWRVVGLQSIAVDCDEKPMARTRACKAFQEMSM